MWSLNCCLKRGGISGVVPVQVCCQSPDILTSYPRSGKHGTVTLDSLITGVCRALILAPTRLNIGQAPWRLVGLATLEPRRVVLMAGSLAPERRQRKRLARHSANSNFQGLFGPCVPANGVLQATRRMPSRISHEGEGAVAGAS